MYKYFFLFFWAFIIAKEPHLRIESIEPLLIDEPIYIQAYDLEPFQKVEIRASALDHEGRQWASKAFFCASDLGFVDVEIAIPLEGSSYSTAHGMGLIFSMTPSEDKKNIFKPLGDSIETTLSLYVDGAKKESKTCTRHLKTEGIKAVDLTKNGIIGTLFIPPATLPPPVVIILSSSSGEIPEGKAKLLASRGYAALALGYFGKEGLPKKLKNIPLEYFEKTLNHLKNIKDIDGSKVTLYGSSRGAELALILASLLPQDVQAVIATVPSSVAYAGLTLLPSAAWLYEGRAFLPPMPMARPQLFKGEGLSKSHPAKMREPLLQGMKNKNALDAATIPVEKICCPILLISSGDDQMWPSDVFAKRVIERVTKEKPYHTIYHSYFPKAGHGITVPYLPTAEPLYYHPAVKLWFCTGGSKEDNALASEKSWQDILQFLKEHAQNITETSR